MFAVCVGMSATAAFAHGDKPHDLDELWRAWSFDPLVVITLSISAAVYILGTRNLWRRGRCRPRNKRLGRGFVRGGLAVAGHRTHFAGPRLGRGPFCGPHDAARDTDARLGAALHFGPPVHRRDVGDPRGVAAKGRSRYQFRPGRPDMAHSHERGRRMGDPRGRVVDLAPARSVSGDARERCRPHRGSTSAFSGRHCFFGGQ